MNAMQASPIPRQSLWPIAITTYFVIAFCGLAIFVTWALRQNTDLVSRDYYRDEILYQKRINDITRTKPFSGQISAACDPSQRFVTLTLPAMHAEQHATGSIHLYRPSDSALDHLIPLALKTGGTQRIETRELSPGLWKLRVEWSALGEEYYFEQSLIVGPP